MLRTKRYHVDDTSATHLRHSRGRTLVRTVTGPKHTMWMDTGRTATDLTNVRTATNLKPHHMKDPAVHGAETHYVEGPTSIYAWTYSVTSMFVCTAPDFRHFSWPEACSHCHGSEDNLRG